MAKLVSHPALNRKNAGSITAASAYGACGLTVKTPVCGTGNEGSIPSLCPFEVKGNFDGANYDLALWVAYYNFLRPHKLHRYKRPLVEDDIIRSGDNMPAKWQLMIFLGQKTIKKMQETVA